MKRALITGITGQDGSYLAELLLEKGYEVYGLIRRKSTDLYGNVEHLKNDIKFIYGDMTDIVSLMNAVTISMPDEIYNLAAQSFVAVSFDQPITTTNINAIGVVNLLEVIRTIKPDAKLYQASTSEMFGKVIVTPQNESTTFNPCSPYGVAKLYAHHMLVNYRNIYNLYACSGILFNHESERRGIEFVSRKITDGVAKIALHKQEYIELGNMDTMRDWGHAKDYVNAMWLMLQNEQPDDYVIATGTQHTVREFVITAFKVAGIDISFSGSGLEEVGINTKTNEIVLKINPKFYRPLEVDTLCGDSSKAKETLKWNTDISFSDLVEKMVKSDMLLNK